MKKLLGILVLGLLWCNTSNAVEIETLQSLNASLNAAKEECLASGKTKSACIKELYGWNLNGYLKDGYKITSEELSKGSNWLITIFVLKKRGSVVICKVDHFLRSTTCREP